MRSSQSPPPRSTFMVWLFSETLLVAAAAPAAAPAITVSAAWMPPSRPPRVGGLGGSSKSLRRAWPGSVPPSSLSGRKDGLVSGGARVKGTPS